MQSTTAKKLAAVEEKLAELSGLGKKIKKLEKEVASLSKKIEAPKDWRLMVGRLADTKDFEKVPELKFENWLE